MTLLERALLGGAALLLGAGLVATGHAQTAASAQPQFTTLKADFVPGDKTIFFDDFSDMTPGDPPPHWKVRGAAPELRAAGDLRQLTFVAGGSLFPNLTGLPKNFTYEADVKFDAPAGNAQLYLMLISKDKEALILGTYVRSNTFDVHLQRKLPKYEDLARKRLPVDIGQPVRLALWLQEGRLRVFVNGEKQLDVNQLDDLPAIDRVELRGAPTGAGVAIGLRTVRFAESTPDLGQVIASTGRYVTHGILFDTDSDRIRPDSAAAIQAIAKALQASPGLNVLIEGHTDASGSAAHNLALSSRRADAVKAVLVSQFAVDAARLTTAGLGSTKPIGPNDTPQGRAQNRRVELVRQ